jgi:hypothetical protein
MGWQAIRTRPLPLRREEASFKSGWIAHAPEVSSDGAVDDDGAASRCRCGRGDDDEDFGELASRGVDRDGDEGHVVGQVVDHRSLR